VRSHWREPEYWRWLWQRVPFGVRAATLAVFLLGLVGAGLVTAEQATSSGSKETVADGPILIETTVQKVVTIRERGKVVRKVIPVVRKIKVAQRPGTVYQTKRDFVTRVEVTPGKSVTHTVSALVPVTSTQQVTVNGKPQIVVRTQVVPTTRTQTVPLTRTVVSTHAETAPGITNNNTVTQTNTRTLTHTETRTQTQTQTQTQVQTVTQTQTVTRTETQTVTATETITVQSDPVTIVRTVTEVVTSPGDGGGGG
jgi:hypothetical protein